MDRRAFDPQSGSCAWRIARSQAFKSMEDKPASITRIKSEKKFGLREEEVIICKNCGNLITAPEFMISVNGHHTHNFINPEGIIYDIGCYSSAGGCVVYGEPTLEHTWFEEFSWRITTCSTCFVHMGWYYQRGEEGFYGLIIDRLAGASATY